MRTQPSGSGMTKTIWQAIVVFWNGVTRSARNHYARQPSYYRRIMPPADPLPPVVVQYQSVSQMRPKGMNNGNEGAEYGPTFQIQGEIFHELIKPLLDGGVLKFSISKKHSGILTLNTSKKRKRKNGMVHRAWSRHDLQLDMSNISLECNDNPEHSCARV